MAMLSLQYVYIRTCKGRGLSVHAASCLLSDMRDS